MTNKHRNPDKEDMERLGRAIYLRMTKVMINDDKTDIDFSEEFEKLGLIIYRRLGSNLSDSKLEQIIMLDFEAWINEHMPKFLRYAILCKAMSNE